jgi:hypothetical protein
MPELQPVREVVGASPTERVDAAALEDATGAAGTPHAGTGRRPLWASLLQPAGASTPDAGAGQPSEPTHAPSAPAPLPARTVAHALPGVQADRLLASLKGVVLAAAAPSAPTAPTGTGVAVGPAQGPSRPGEGATAKTADLSSGAPSNPAHQKPPLAKTGIHTGAPKAGIPITGAAKDGPPKGAPPKRAEPNDADGARPGVPRDPSSDDILPSGRRKRFGFRLR